LLVETNSGIGYTPAPDDLPRRYLRKKIARLYEDVEMEDWEIFPNYPVIEAGLGRLEPEVARLTRA
jgi:hypothetical protein